jgi:hypothetical protein
MKKSLRVSHIRQSKKHPIVLKKQSCDCRYAAVDFREALMFIEKIRAPPQPTKWAAA